MKSWLKSSPLLTTLTNQCIEASVRISLKNDPFWQAHLAKLNGLRLYLELYDIGFKRVIQWGPNDIYLQAPYTDADLKLLTRLPYLPLLQSEARTQAAIADGHLQLLGSDTAKAQFQHFCQTYHPDWEATIANFLPDSLAYQLTSLTETLFNQCQQSQQACQQSYHFWRQNHES